MGDYIIVQGAVTQEFQHRWPRIDKYENTNDKLINMNSIKDKKGK